MTTLTGTTVLVAGGARAIGLGIAQAAAAAGARVVIGARDEAKARDAAASLPDARGIRFDVTDEAEIAAAAAELGSVDHVVLTASAHHNVPVTELDHASVVTAFEAKVIGPMLVAKHLAPRMTPGGSIVLFSGVAAWRPAPKLTVMGITNGAVSFAARHLATELAPIRVNAVSPGIIDSGSQAAMSPEARQAMFDGYAASTLAGRVGRTEDVVDAVLWLLGATYVSGETIHVEGGARTG